MPSFKKERRVIDGTVDRLSDMRSGDPEPGAVSQGESSGMATQDFITEREFSPTFMSRRHVKALFPLLPISIGLLALHYFIDKYYPSDWPWVIVLHLLVLFANVFWVVVPIFKWRCEKYVVTETSVRTEWGVLYKQSREIRLTHIASISEERGVLDRVFGCGTLNFYDAAADSQPRTSGVWNKTGQPKTGVCFHDLPNFKDARDRIKEAKRASINGKDFKGFPLR